MSHLPVYATKVQLDVETVSKGLDTTAPDAMESTVNVAEERCAR
jgi:hypothetical protein